MHYHYIRIFECPLCYSSCHRNSYCDDNVEVDFGVICLSEEAAALFCGAIAGSVTARFEFTGL
jgi:hypothetical protein